MLKIYVHELEEKESQLKNFFLKNNDIEILNLLKKYYYKNHYIVEILSDYEIFVLLNLVHSPIDIRVLETLFDIDILQLENLKSFNHGNQIIKFKIDFNKTEFYIGIHENKIIYIYFLLIGSPKINQNLNLFLNYFKYPFFILENLNDEIDFAKIEEKNFFTYSEILYYLNYLNLNFGRLFYSFYKNNEVFKKFISINNYNLIDNDDLKIQNSSREFLATKSTKRYRVNKSQNIIINDLEKIKNINFYENNNNKFYFIYNDEIYIIKEILPFNKENIEYINKNFNRSNEFLFVYENNKLKHIKYLIKATKSTSKTIKNKLLKVEDIKFFIDNFITQI